MSEEEMAQMQILQTMQMKDGMRTYNKITKDCVNYCIGGFRVKVRSRLPPPPAAARSPAATPTPR